MDCCNWNDDICYETETDSAFYQHCAPLAHRPFTHNSVHMREHWYSAWCSKHRAVYSTFGSTHIREHQLNQHPEQQFTTSTWGNRRDAPILAQTKAWRAGNPNRRTILDSVCARKWNSAPQTKRSLLWRQGPSFRERRRRAANEPLDLWGWSELGSPRTRIHSESWGN